MLCTQEKQIRAKANIKQLGDRMRDQRQQVGVALERNLRIFPKVPPLQWLRHQLSSPAPECKTRSSKFKLYENPSDQCEAAGNVRLAAAGRRGPGTQPAHLPQGVAHCACSCWHTSACCSSTEQWVCAVLSHA